MHTGSFRKFHYDGLQQAVFITKWLIFLILKEVKLEVFSTLGIKKFPYLKLGPFGNPIFSINQ